MSIEPLAAAHAPRIAEIHAEALAGDFLPSLGVRFLIALYRAILDLRLGFGFVAVDAGQVVGFVLASADTSALFRRALLRRGPALAWGLLPALLRRPALIGNLLQTFAYPQREGNVDAPAELVVIAVDAARRNSGVGAALCRALDEDFARRGVARYKVTVNADNAGANRFYRRLGFESAYSFTLYGRQWNLYTRSLLSR